MRRVVVVLATLLHLACTDDPPAGIATPDASGSLLCTEDTDCPGDLTCNGGVCGPAAIGGDSGTQAGGAEIEVCTVSGCAAPHKVELGGSRAGVMTSQTVVIRSTGTRPVELRNLELLGSAGEFTLDPVGQVDIVLAPGEEQAVRVTHTAADGIADRAQLEIVSSARTSRVLVELTTEYKGVPSLHASTDAASSTNQVTVLDFGQVQLGTSESRTLYLKNVDTVIDGSILTVDQVNVDPATSSNFAVTLSTPAPANLNQYDALCATNANCRASMTDTCDTTLGVCREMDGALRDILEVTVTFSANAPGAVEERLQILSNDAGQRAAVRTILLRGRASVRDLDVSPDPIDLTGSFVGYTARRRVTLTNSGSADVTVSALTLARGSTFALDLTRLTGALPVVIAPTMSESFEVTYAPSAARTHRDQLRVESDDARAPVQAIEIIGTASVAPVLELSATRVDFGDVHVAASGTVRITARNVGGSELQVPSVTTTSTIPFSVDVAGFPTRLAPGASASFAVNYRPRGTSFPNAENGQLIVQTNDPAAQPSVRLPITGRSIAPRATVFPPGPINFNTLGANPVAPSIFAGQQVSTQVVLLNAGTGPLVVSSLSTQNDVRGVFLAATGPTLPTSLAAGQSITIDLAYGAPLAGTDGADLIIATNDAYLMGGLARVSLLGNVADCGAPVGAVGTWSPLDRRCSFACAPDRWDLDGDLTQPGTNGCEYACTYRSATDLPDALFEDLDCDGIDGQRDQAVFVSPAGNDGQDGLAPTRPKRTIAGAIAAAQSAGRYVVVGAGTYTSGTVVLADGVDLYGGYDPIGWGRSAANISEIVHDNSPVGGALIAVRGDNIGQETILDRMRVRTLDAQVLGANNYAVYCNACAGLRITRSLVRAGAAGGGAAGPDGARGANGGDGINGGSGSCSGGAQPGGAGGTSTCQRTGGTGGNGGNRGSNSGVMGGTGEIGTPGGAGGRGGDPGQQGTDATGGSGGVAGGNGGGGSGGGVSMGVWISGAGAAGTPGTSGNGGGGGGGGGGQGCFPCSDAGGNGGGGGGAGGCGGAGGNGGAGGGGAFGVFLLASGGAQITDSEIVAGAGGAGGAGGLAGGGGTGGALGLGGTGCVSDIRRGGNGGAGGNGGPGGHGGGGAGGPSYAVYRDPANVTISGTVLTPGAGGAGGPSLGAGGATGASGTTN